MNFEMMFAMIKQIYTREEIPTMLKLFNLNDRVCELGVAKGDNLWTMIKLGFPKYALGIDAWSHEICPFYTQDYHDSNLAKVERAFAVARKWSGSEIDIIKGDHSKLVDNYEDGFFDYVYIDSSHLYEDTVRDIAQWWPKIKKGGIIAGHDYSNSDPLYGVIQAVTEFVEDNNIKYLHITREQTKSWIILKTE